MGDVLLTPLSPLYEVVDPFVKWGMKKINPPPAFGVPLQREGITLRSLLNFFTEVDF